IISQEFPNDTLLDMRPARLYLLTAHGVKLGHPGVTSGEFAAVRGQEPALDSLVDYVNGIHTAQKKEAAREARIRAAVARLVAQPLTYTVKRGDALSLIATKFDATPDQIRQWNQIVGDRVKIGQKLLVKPAKK
ncbi:MAG TPA: LysM peptidoglycan-binding domain-containing protein, partial [Gemmatimonadaceae bacterium]|nr:LysM peptidoglycan-binding domain-containing protein [Gemmatimonadaceae bacterium]